MVDTERAADLDDCMARMTARDDEYRYSVAWIDCLARGRTWAGPCSPGATTPGSTTCPAPRRADALRFDPVVRAQVPVTPPSGLLNPLTVAAFNELWFRKAPRPARRAARSRSPRFFHPLDGVGDWNRLYGRRGFVQYQFVVPVGADDALRAVHRAAERRAACRRSWPC